MEEYSYRKLSEEWEAKQQKENEETRVALKKIGLIIICILLVIIYIFGCAYINPMFMPKFLKGATDVTVDNYIEYISKYNEETEFANIHSWTVPLAYIYVLDENIQFDEGEQYLLNQFKEAGLISGWYDERDFEKYFNEHPEVIKNFYEKTGVPIDSVAIDKEQIQQEIAKILKNREIFTSIIEEKLA